MCNNYAGTVLNTQVCLHVDDLNNSYMYNIFSRYTD